MNYPDEGPHHYAVCAWGVDVEYIAIGSRLSGSPPSGILSSGATLPEASLELELNRYGVPKV